MEHLTTDIEWHKPSEQTRMISTDSMRYISICTDAHLSYHDYQ